MSNGPQRGQWQAKTCLQQGTDVMVWLASKPTGEKGLLKIAQTAKGQGSLARETILLKKVDHPRVPELIVCGDERKWLVRQFVEGETLSAGAPLPLGAAVEIAAGLAEILAHLHERGLVHADLKPANIIVDGEGHVHLLDFGIACIELSRAKPGHFKGTLGYAAPEQLQGQPLQCGTDVYSLGIILYELIAGRLPFLASDPSALAYLPLAALPEPISNLKLALPADLVEMVMKMLARDVTRRPTSVGLGEKLRMSAASPALPIVVGMKTARDALRSLISVAERGQGAVVVVYGPSGSGRQTLIDEAIQIARREGLPVCESVPAALDALNVTVLEEVVLYSGSSSEPEAVALASRILSGRLPCLLFLRSEQPLAVLERRGARHVAPQPLTEADLVQLLEAADRPVAQAPELWRRTKGNPGRIREALDLQNQGATQLSSMESAVMAQSHSSPQSITAIAAQLKISQHAAVDIAERLVDLGLLEVVEDGTSIRPRTLEATTSA